jgi:hypothetical protein
LIHCLVLPGWPVLTDNDVDRDGGTDARKDTTAFPRWQRFNNYQGAVLAVPRISARPDDGKYLSGAEVVYGAAVPIQVPTGWITKTQAIIH